MSKNKLDKHVKTDKVKWILTGVSILLIIVMLVGISLQIFGTGNLKPSEWFKPDEQNASEKVVTDGDGNMMQSGHVYAMPANMIFATTASEQTNASEEIIIKATIKPEIATNKTVDWSVAFVNANSEWANGKNVNEYVTVSPTSDGALTATVNCLKAFGEQIKVIVTSRDNPEAKAECVLDYARRIVDIALWGEIIDDYRVNYGSNEMILDMVIPSYDDYIECTENKSVWVADYYLPYLSPEFRPTEHLDPVEYEEHWEKYARGIKYSDYTLLDQRLFINDESQMSKREVDVVIAEGFSDIMKEMVKELTGYELPFERMMFGNNPIVMFFEWFYTTVSERKLTEELYYKYTAKFVEWIKANPDTPILENTYTITGKYSIFSKTISFKYNPDTVKMPVFGVELDQGNIIV